MNVFHIKPGMVLSDDVLDEEGSLLLEKGITLTESYIQRLRNLGIGLVKISDPQADALKQNELISPEMRNELTACFAALYNQKSAALLDSELSADCLHRISRIVDTTIMETEHQLPQILNVQIRQPSISEQTHAVNVCILSIITGIYLKLSRPALYDLALGALFHDLGKAVRPIDEGAAADSNKLHPTVGHDILRSKLGPVVAKIAAQHHENYDGSGYPNGLAGQAIHPLSRITAIANFYDVAINQAMLTNTPRQEIIERMLANGNTRFDLNTLSAFFHTIAIYQVGSLVRLSTGECGYVIKNRANFPFRPLVRIENSSGYQELDLIYKPNITIVDLIED